MLSRQASFSKIFFVKNVHGYNAGMKTKALLAALVVAPLLAAVMIATTVWFMYQNTYQGPDVTFTVLPGETFGAVNARLSNQGLISNPRLFHWLARYQGNMEKLRAGAFPINHGMKMSDVLETLIHGQPFLTSVTIPEGKNLWEIAAILEKAGLVEPSQFITMAQDPTFTESLGIPAPTVEGYLFPETYRFAPGTPVKDILTTMIREFHRRIGRLNEAHSFLSPHEVVILASMVEKETGAKIERPQIASVFLNRLRKHMRLESDPTTIYGIWENYHGNLKREDLQTLTPYNTYRVAALPAGPIANPSLEAIQAVMNPALSENLFFVSKNDGTHAFTKTYADHRAAVDEWQRKRSNRQGKSWRQLKQ